MTAYAVDPLRDSRHRSARSALDVADWLAWLKLGGTAASTLDAYERTVAGLIRSNPNHELKDFTDGDIARFLMTFPAPSRRIRKAHVSSMFKWAIKTRRIQVNPIDFLPAIKPPSQAHIEVFTPSEKAALCALGSPDGHLMRVLLESGLRKKEAIHITPRRLDFDQMIIIVQEGAKGSKQRTVPMTVKCAAALTNLIFLEGIDRDEYLWYDRPGGSLATKVRRSVPIADTSFHRWWVRCIEEARVEYRKPHTTRHSYATWQQDLGVPIEEISENLGHASISTTADLYVHTKAKARGERLRSLIAAREV